MFVDFRRDPQAPRCRGRRRDTGARLVYCAAAHEEEGWVEQYVMSQDEAGRLLFVMGPDRRAAGGRRPCRVTIEPWDGHGDYLLPGRAHVRLGPSGPEPLRGDLPRV